MALILLLFDTKTFYLTTIFSIYKFKILLYNNLKIISNSKAILDINKLLFYVFP